MVLRMRIFMWAAVALLAIVVLQLRPEDPGRDDRSHRPINGRTSQGEAVWAIARDGQIEVIELGWQLRCSNGASDRIASRFQDGRERFRHTGRRFDASDEVASPPTARGWVGYFDARIGGDLSADGDRAAGTAHATVTWFDAEHRAQVTCRTGPVRWSVTR